MSLIPRSPRPGLTVDGHLQGLVELHTSRGPLWLGPVAVASSQDGGGTLLVTLLGRGRGAGEAGSSERRQAARQDPPSAGPCSRTGGGRTERPADQPSVPSPTLPRSSQI